MNVQNSPIPLWPAISCLLVVLISGLLAVFVFAGTEGVSRYLFLRLDMVGIFLTAFLACTAIPLAKKSSDVMAPKLGAMQSRWVGWIAAVTFLVSVSGTNMVYGGYALSMDEWMPRLQARIFETGHATATLPEHLRDYGRALFHSFATFDPNSGEVASSYRPGLAALISVFDLINGGIYVSAVLNAGAVLLVARVTRQLWPDCPLDAPVIAALVLATSQQALAASMTSYAMSAHLFFSLLWLTFFLTGTLWAHVVAALVGVLASSLHQVHVHLFFALPFLMVLFWQRNWHVIFVYGLIYAFGHLAVISWDKVLIVQVLSQGSEDARTVSENLRALTALPTLSDIASIWANIVRLFVWQNLAVIPSLWLLWYKFHGRVPWLGTILASIFLTLLPHIFIVPDQGHGWGYRYLHVHLGLLAALAALGWSSTQDVRYRLWLVTLTIFSIVMIGLRAMQIHSFVTPYILATDMSHSQDAEVVIVDSYRVLAGNDIPRNDPTDMQVPYVMSLHALTPKEIAKLCSLYSVVLLSADELAALGLTVYATALLPEKDLYLEKIAILQSAGCSNG